MCLHVQHGYLNLAKRLKLNFLLIVLSLTTLSKMLSALPINIP